MKKNITSFQIGVLIFFMCFGLYEGIANVSLFSSTEQDAWLSFLFSILLSLIPIIFTIFIINYEPDKNIIEKNQKLFGKYLGYIINFILCIYIFMLLILTCWNLFSFVKIEFLNNTPQIFIGILFLIAAFYANTKGVETILKSGEIILYISLFFIVIIFLSLFGLINLNNLKPVLSHGFNPVIYESLRLLSYTIIPSFIITIIPKNYVIDNKNLTKVILRSYIISQFLLFLITFIIITVLGPELATIYQFPAYYAVRKINIIGVIENTENFFSILWIYSMYFIITMCLYYIKIYMREIFKIKNKKIENYFIYFILF